VTAEITGGEVAAEKSRGNIAADGDLAAWRCASYGRENSRERGPAGMARRGALAAIGESERHEDARSLSEE